MFVCVCKGITDTQIRDAVNGGAESVRAVKESLGVSSQCGRCVSHVRDVVKETLEAGNNTGLDCGNYYSVA